MTGQNITHEIGVEEQNISLLPSRKNIFSSASETALRRGERQSEHQALRRYHHVARSPCFLARKPRGAAAQPRARRRRRLLPPASKAAADRLPDRRR